jgi:hypothetical protein
VTDAAPRDQRSRQHRADAQLGSGSRRSHATTLGVGPERRLTARARSRADAPRYLRLVGGVVAVVPALLVVSELVTNSVTFGPKRPIALALTVGTEGVVGGEVIDRGMASRPRRKRALRLGPRARGKACGSRRTGACTSHRIVAAHAVGSPPLTTAT